MNHIMPYMPTSKNMFRDDSRIIRRPFGFGFRPFGFGPFGFGFPLLGGFLGGLTAGTLLRPPYYPYPPYPPYPYYGGFWY